MPRFLERDEVERAAPIEAYPWDRLKICACSLSCRSLWGGCTKLSVLRLKKFFSVTSWLYFVPNSLKGHSFAFQ